MSGTKRGAITMECTPGSKNDFHQVLPSFKGLSVEFGEDDDTVHIQYDLESQQEVDALLQALNSKQHMGFRMVNHTEEPAPTQGAYDIAADISKLLNYEDEDVPGPLSNNPNVNSNPMTIGAGAIGKIS